MRKSLVIIFGLVIVLGLLALATAGPDKQASTKPSVKKAASSSCLTGGKVDCTDCPKTAESCKDGRMNCEDCPKLNEQSKNGKMNAAACPHAGAVANGNMVRPVAHSVQGIKATSTNAAKVSAGKVKVVPAKNAKVSAAIPKVKAKANAKAGCCAGGGE